MSRSVLTVSCSTTLVQIVEEFPDLLGEDLVTRIEDSVEAAAVGAMRRNGSYPEGDNLILGYSNPGLMRTLTVGWIGARRNNQTLIDFAKQQGEDLLSLFERCGDGLSEYNAPTYYGMDLWALAANIAYGAEDAPMTSNAATIIPALWKDVAAHYNPFLGNMVGPYDRAYTRDATTHSAILSLWWWGMFGREYGPQPPLGEADLLYDVAQGASLALVMDKVAALLDADTTAVLRSKGWWEGSRTVNKTIYEDLSAAASPRVAASWISAGVMIGGQTVAETVNRGNQFVPAIVHWAADPDHTPYPYNGFFSLYPSASTITSEVGAGTLTVSYPNTTQDGTDIFTFALTGMPPRFVGGARPAITGFDNLPCLSVNVSAPGLEPLNITYGTQLRDHYIYNISYAVPGDFEGIPSVSFEVEYTC